MLCVKQTSNVETLPQTKRYNTCCCLLCACISRSLARRPARLIAVPLACSLSRSIFHSLALTHCNIDDIDYVVDISLGACSLI